MITTPICGVAGLFCYYVTRRYTKKLYDANYLENLLRDSDSEEPDTPSFDDDDPSEGDFGRRRGKKGRTSLNESISNDSEVTLQTSSQVAEAILKQN